jgi:hypothetical protein
LAKSPEQAQTEHHAAALAAPKACLTWCNRRRNDTAVESPAFLIDELKLLRIFENNEEMLSMPDIAL